MKIRGLIPTLAALLAGCATANESGRGYPSLAKRAVESAPEEQMERGDAVSAPIAGDTALKTRISELEQQARRGNDAFEALYGEVAGQVGRSGDAAVSSEQWVMAQVNLGRLEGARHDSVYALADLDDLYAARMAAVADGKAAGGVDEVLAARGAVLAMVDAQNDRIDNLRRGLKEP